MADFDPVSYMMGQKAAGGGGGGGSSTLAGLTDVDISNPTDGQTLVYNASSGKWENGASGGVLFVNIDSSTFALDKTWQEIYDADMAVITSRDPEDRGKEMYVVTNVYIDGTEGVNASYSVIASLIYVEDGVPSAEAISFRASARNDYPAPINSPA